MQSRHLALTLFAFVCLVPHLHAAPPGKMGAFLADHCIDCHQGKDAEGGLDLDKLPTTLQSDEVVAKWGRIVERVYAGEMPPEDSSALESAERKTFVQETVAWIRNFQDQETRQLGRVRARRLTNLQLERSLQAVLGIDIPLATHMPEEPRNSEFTTVAAGQMMSHFQLEQHLKVVDLALDEAMRRVMTGPDEWTKNLKPKDIARSNPRRRTREPEIYKGRAVTWHSNVTYYGRLPCTTAREDGWYRITMKVAALNKPKDHGVWCTVRSGECVSSAPLFEWVGAFEVEEKTKTVSFEAWLPKGHMIEARVADASLKKARFKGGQVGAGEGTPQKVAGLAIESMKLERFHHRTTDADIRALLFHDFALKKDRDLTKAKLTLANTEENTRQLMRRFARKVFRRPTRDAELYPYFQLVADEIKSGASNVSALRTGYRALLCSPRFLYFQEPLGPLDDHAAVSRLSYMLWNSPPDWELMKLANEGKLRTAGVLTGQVKRMLNHPRGRSFVKDFAAQWLDLDQIDFTEPDRKLYRDFDLVVQQSMLQETHRYLDAMLMNDLPIRELIKSSHSFLNSRLARYYGIDGEFGDRMTKAKLHPKHHRGGLLTHGAILKVTANGTTTSPVIRGVWVSEKLLGQHIPPPPENVPAIEPDIRGAKSIRDMLEKHKAIESCASCHRKIDPPGFALENYDPAGKWRDHYVATKGGKGAKKLPIDASYHAFNGKSFKDIDSFKSLVVADEDRLARNFAEKLIAYGTGASVRLADRWQIHAIARKSKESGHGMRSILMHSITSGLFLTK